MSRSSWRPAALGVTVVMLVGGLAYLGLGRPAGTHHPSRTSALFAGARQRLAQGYGRLPLAFEQNRGQASSQVRFLAHGAGFSLGLTDSGPVLALNQSNTPVQAAGSAGRNRPVAPPTSVRALSVGFVGLSAGVRLAPAAPLTGRANYLIGRDPRRWHTGIPTFSKVAYLGVWRGIDASFQGSQGQLEYAFTVAPGADSRQIALRYRGQSALRLDHSGNLLLATGPGRVVRQLAPQAYQLTVDGRRAVASRYVLSRGGVRILVGGYDHRLPLVIDPTLEYSTYLGGSGIDAGNAIAVDGSGNAYVTGTTAASFPTTVGAKQTASGGANDAFVSKLNASGTGLVYSTYLGGAFNDIGYGIAVDGSGDAYVTGTTSSTDFPTTVGAKQTASGGNSDAFVTKLNPTGTALAYSTYLGGTGGETGYGIAVDTAGSAYVTGFTGSTDFPTTVGAKQTTSGGGFDAFVSKLNASGSALTYSTYLGGGSNDTAWGIALDSAGTAYVSGDTNATDFPTTVGAYQTTRAGNDDAFVSKLNATGTALAYSTYLGGTGGDDQAKIAVDGSGSAYVTGITVSTDFPTSAGAFQTAGDATGNAFVSKLNAGGTALAYSTYLGGAGVDQGNGIAVDGSGNAYVTGFTNSNGFPTTPDAHQSARAGSNDAFETKLNASGTALAYSTFIGGAAADAGAGIAIDSAGSAYVVGTTSSTDFPATAGAAQTANAGNDDAFVSKLTATAAGPRSTSTSVSCAPNPVTVGSASTCTATVSDAGAGTKTTPTGTVGFASDSSGSFSAGGSCALAAGAAAGVASCAVTYTPSATASGTHKITAGYSGDASHTASGGNTNLTVTAVSSSAGGGNTVATATPHPSPTPVAGNQGGTLRITPAGCQANRLILTDVFAHAGRTQLLGVAPTAARGKKVTIVSAWNGKAVATPTVQQDLSFTAAVPLPPRSLRLTNRARYFAKLGSVRSLVLKFARRMYTTAITSANGTITFSGAVIPPLATPLATVVVRASASCSAIAAGTIVGTAKPTRQGNFTAALKLPASLLHATTVYLRAETKVRRTATSKKTFGTFTLIRGLSIAG